MSLVPKKHKMWPCDYTRVTHAEAHTRLEAVSKTRTNEWMNELTWRGCEVRVADRRRSPLDERRSASRTERGRGDRDETWPSRGSLREGHAAAGRQSTTADRNVRCWVTAAGCDVVGWRDTGWQHQRPMMPAARHDPSAPSFPAETTRAGPPFNSLDCLVAYSVATSKTWSSTHQTVAKNIVDFNSLAAFKCIIKYVNFSSHLGSVVTDVSNICGQL